MSRIALGITLSILAIATAVAGCISYYHAVSLSISITPRASLTTHFYDGRMRFFWITSEKFPVDVVTSRRGSRLVLGRMGVDPDREYVFGRGPVLSTTDRLFDIRIGDRRAVPAFGGQWRSGSLTSPKSIGGVELSYVRFPVWLPVVLLLLQPIRAILFGPWLWRRRQRMNQCQWCGYDLTDRVSPRCPECGCEIDPVGEAVV